MDTKHMTATIDIDANDDEALVSRWKHNIALKLHFPARIRHREREPGHPLIEKFVARGCPPHLAVEIARP